MQIICYPLHAVGLLRNNTNDAYYLLFLCELFVPPDNLNAHIESLKCCMTCCQLLDPTWVSDEALMMNCPVSELPVTLYDFCPLDLFVESQWENKPDQE